MRSLQCGNSGVFPRHVPNDTADVSSVGYSRVLTCRRFLEAMRDGATFAFVEMADSIWLEIDRPKGSVSYYADTVGFFIDEDNVISDGFGLVLCRLKAGKKSDRHGGTLFSLAVPIDPAILATCGDAGGFVPNRYVEVHRDSVAEDGDR